MLTAGVEPVRVGICGSSAGEEEPITAEARYLGELLAMRGHMVVTGGGDGLPYTVAVAARAKGADVIGFSPAIDAEEHMKRFRFPTDAFTELRFRSSGFEFSDLEQACLKLRNVHTISYCDAIVFIRGKTGTLNEFTIAYDMGKLIGALTGAGGVADHLPDLITLCNKPMGSVVVASPRAEELLARLEAIGRRRG